MMSALIKEVEKRSYADKAGIKAGERLLSINGHCIRDVLDYDFYGYDRLLTIEIENENHYIKNYSKHIKWQKTIMAWWDKHLKNDSSWWEELY